MKAASNIGLLQYIGSLGAGFDIVSGGELARVVAAGGDLNTVVFAGVGKSDEEIRQALIAGVRSINVESVSELTRVAAIAAELGRVAPVCLRVNPAVDVETHPYLATGLKTSKFGIPIDEIVTVVDSEIKGVASLSLIGLSCHIGSQINDVVPLRNAYSQVFALADCLSAKGYSIHTVDLGGGFGVSYSGTYTPLDLDQFSSMLHEVHGGRPYTVLVEPGKFLVGEAGLLLSSVVRTKTNGERSFVVLDAGMNDLLRPALYEAYHRIVPLRCYDQSDQESAHERIVDIVGPVCESGCTFGTERPFPTVEDGEVVVICDAGAYGFTMASNYNSRCLPAEVLLLASGEAHLIREREAYEDLWRKERLLAPR
jgi:diaminopimelate decarboxylase